MTSPVGTHPRVVGSAIADFVLAALSFHAALGTLFAVAFHWRGLARIDPAAAGGSLGFRMLVTPGVVALWPLLARRWWRAAHAERAT